LASRGQPEVGLSIIEGVAIFVVNKKSLRGIYKFPVHRDHFCPDVIDCEIANGIEFAIKASDVPLEFTEGIVVLLVKNCELPVAKPNPPVGVAEAEKAIEQQGTGENKIEPVWDFDCDS
jgi:hypothetical protein